MRSTVRALIMQHRMKDAFAGFNARYDFLRFTDAKIIAPDNQMIVRLHVDQTTMDASRAMRDADELFSPVYEDAVLADCSFTVACCLSRESERCGCFAQDKKESPIGFVDMMDIVHLMLGAVKNGPRPLATRCRLPVPAAHPWRACRSFLDEDQRHGGGANAAGARDRVGRAVCQHQVRLHL